MKKAQGRRQKAEGRRQLAPPGCLLLSAFCLLTCAGCRSNCDLVEAELRTREIQLHGLREEVARLEAYNDALQREVRALRGGTAPATPEQAAQTYGVRTLVLGRPTGGVDDDGRPGDEALQVLAEPRDSDGHAVKAPGTLAILALEITPEGLKKPLSSWQFGGDELRRAWRSGLLTTGYSFLLPWKCWPTVEKVRVVARLTLPDGRTFEAERDITVRVAPPAYRKNEAVSDGPVLEPPAPLPMPRPLESLPPPTVGDAGRKPVTSAAHWQKPRRVPLSEAVELLEPVAVPPRIEWRR